MGGGWVATAFERVQRLERRSIRPIPKPSGGVGLRGGARAGGTGAAAGAGPIAFASLRAGRAHEKLVAVRRIRRRQVRSNFEGSSDEVEGKGRACDRSRLWFGCGDRQAVCRRRRFVDVRGSGRRPRASHGVGHHRVRRLGRGGAGRRGGSCALRGPSDSDGAALRSHRHCRQQRRRRTAQAGTRYQPSGLGARPCASISPARS